VGEGEGVAGVEEGEEGDFDAGGHVDVGGGGGGEVEGGGGAGAGGRGG